METLEGLKIPVEIIKKILNYVPRKDYWNIANASRGLYSIICDLEKFKYPLVFDDEIHIYISDIKSMVNSSRKFRIFNVKMEMNDDEIWSESLNDLMASHGKTIENATFEDTSTSNTILQARTLVRLLNQMPNLKVLKLSKFDKLYINCRRKHALNLPNLEELILDNHEAHVDKFLLCFHQNTIKKFSCLYPCAEIKNFVRNQKSIKELTINYDYEDANIFKDLAIDKVTFTFLFFGGGRDSSANFMLNFIRLHPNLKEIHMDLWEDDNYDLCDQKKSRETFEIFETCMDDRELKNLNSNWCNLKHLTIKRAYNFSLNEVLNYLPNLRSLQILKNNEDLDKDDDNYEAQRISQRILSKWITF